MKTPSELADARSRTDVLLDAETARMAELLLNAAEDLQAGVAAQDRVRAWSGMLKVSLLTQHLERRLKTRVVLGD